MGYAQMKNTLPPPPKTKDELWAVICHLRDFTLPELQYPDRINCATEFVDKWVASGQGDRVAIITPTETLTYGPDGERRGEGMRVFVASYAPKPRMIVFGAIDFAAAVAELWSAGLLTTAARR